MKRANKAAVIALLSACAVMMGGCKATKTEVPEKNDTSQETDGAADTKQESEGTKTENSEKEDDAAETQLVNPWRDAAEDDVYELLGAYFIIPEDATDVSYSVMDADKLAQAKFTLDDLEFTARMKRTDAFEDISGYNYNWDVEDDGDVSGSPAVYKAVRSDEGDVHLALWRDEVEGIMLSLGTSASDLDGFDIQAIAERMYQPSDLGFAPADFLEEKAGKTTFDSYDEVISYLEPGQGYAYIELTGYEGEILLVTEGVYDDLEGHMASIGATVYLKRDDGTVTDSGIVFSGGTAYPIRCEDGILYTGGNHSYESYWITQDGYGLMVKDSISEIYDENGNASYSGFLRDTNDFEHDREITDEDGAEIFEQYTAADKEVVNFTVIK